MLTLDDFYEWERNSRDTIDVKRCYIDIAGDLVSGILLSQIIYWFLPGEHGIKLRVEKEGKLWLTKGRVDWYEECRISPKQFDRAIKVLYNEGLVISKRFRFKGSPTIHIWLNVETLLERVNSIFTKGIKPILQNSKIRIDPKGEMEFDQSGQSLTEITPKTTTKTTSIDMGKVKPSHSSNGTEVKDVLRGMQAFYGFPDETDIDPIPNYGKEGKTIKRLLARGFTISQILDCWMLKCQQAGQFKSMVYVNEDIKIEPRNDPNKYLGQKYGHMVQR